MAIYITRNTVDGETGTIRRYNFTAVNNLTDRNVINALTFQAPNQDEGGASAFNLSGKSRVISFNFEILDDGTDKSNGTHTSTVTTIKEQYQYLVSTLMNPRFDTEFTLVVELEAGVQLFSLSGFLSNLTPTVTFQRSTVIACQLEFTPGTNTFKAS